MKTGIRMIRRKVITFGIVKTSYGYHVMGYYGVEEIGEADKQEIALKALNDEVGSIAMSDVHEFYTNDTIDKPALAPPCSSRIRGRRTSAASCARSSLERVFCPSPTDMCTRVEVKTGPVASRSDGPWNIYKTNKVSTWFAVCQLYVCF